MSFDWKDRIHADLGQWYAGKWAELVDYGPTCTCGMKKQPMTGIDGMPVDLTCQRHPEKNVNEEHEDEHGRTADGEDVDGSSVATGNSRVSPDPRANEKKEEKE